MREVGPKLCDGYGFPGFVRAADMHEVFGGPRVRPGTQLAFAQLQTSPPGAELNHVARRLVRGPMNGAQRTFDRRGARAIRLEARPPASFSSLLAPQRAQDVIRSNAVVVLLPLTTFMKIPKITHTFCRRGFIVKASRRSQAPLGAACDDDRVAHRSMALLTELEMGSVGRPFYRHGAPAGALAHPASCEICG